MQIRACYIKVASNVGLKDTISDRSPQLYSVVSKEDLRYWKAGPSEDQF